MFFLWIQEIEKQELEATRLLYSRHFTKTEQSKTKRLTRMFYLFARHSNFYAWSVSDFGQTTNGFDIKKREQKKKKKKKKRKENKEKKKTTFIA